MLRAGLAGLAGTKEDGDAGNGDGVLPDCDGCSFIAGALGCVGVGVGVVCADPVGMLLLKATLIELGAAWLCLGLMCTLVGG